MKYCNYEATFKTKDQEIKIAPFDFELIELYSSEWEDKNIPPFNFCSLLMELIDYRFGDVLKVGEQKRFAASILNMNYFKFNDYIVKANREQVDKSKYSDHIKNLKWILNTDMEKDRLEEEKKLGKPLSPKTFKKEYQATFSERRIKKMLAELSDERIKEINNTVDEYMSLTVDCCQLIPSQDTKVLPIGRSKLGGHAEMPKEEEYPLDKGGLPMRLVCQLNLKEMADFIPAKIKKKEGMLSFFISTQEIYFDNAYKNYAVRFYPNIDELIRHPFEHPTESVYHESEVTYKFRKSLPSENYSSVQIIKNKINRDRDLFYELMNIESYHISSHFLGYSYFSQLNSIKLNDKDITDEIDNLIPLLHLSSHLVKGVENRINFCDGDSIGFFIRPEDLEKWDFKNVSISLYS